MISNGVRPANYDEFGIPATTNAANQGRFGYTGQAWLPGLGMSHYKARMYSPTLGQFMQADPIGYGDGMNLYAYVDAMAERLLRPERLRELLDDSSATVLPAGALGAPMRNRKSCRSNLSCPAPTAGPRPRRWSA